jgi:hypothetical protein
MTEKPKLTAAHLRIVTSNDTPTDDVPDRLVASPERAGTRRRRIRLPRLSEPFIRVRLAWLNKARWHGVFPAELRLYLYLLYASGEGQRAVRLTNAEVASDLGISRWQKHRYLQRLERAGFIAVARSGRSAPIITVSGL